MVNTDCGGVVNESILADAQGKILSNGFNTFDIPTSEHSATIQIRKPACWKYEVSGSSSSYVPCEIQGDMANCCITQYMIFDETTMNNPPTPTSVSVTLLGYDYRSGTDCGGIIGQSCEYNCDSDSIMVEGIYDPEDLYVCSDETLDKGEFSPLTMTMDGWNYTVHYLSSNVVQEGRLTQNKILKIEHSNNYPYDMGTLYRYAMKCVMRKQLMEAFDGNGNTNCNIKFYTPSCWEKGSTISEPCDYDNCCEVTYDATWRDALNIVYVTTQPGNFTDPICDQPCEPVCSYLEFSGQFKYGIPIEEKTENLDSPASSWVRPNPTSGMTEIFISSGINGDFRLDIINSIGEAVHSMTVRKESYEAAFKVDASILPQGIYYYKITSDGLPMSEGKFVIIK
jgi:hypothetical protein